MTLQARSDCPGRRRTKRRRTQQILCTRYVLWVQRRYALLGVAASRSPGDGATDVADRQDCLVLSKNTPLNKNSDGRKAFMKILVVSTCVCVSLWLHCGAVLAGATEGKAVFDNQCSNCHTTVIGKNGFGPSLAEVIGRTSGGLSDYHYSTAMANAGLTWNETTLDQFLASSTTKVPGTLMAVSITDPTSRADVISYLKTLGSAPQLPPSSQAATPTPLGRGPTSQELLAAATDREGWLYSSKDYTGQRYVASKQITAKNAARLRPVCIYRSTSVGATQSNPLVYRGTMYFTIDEATVAIDAASAGSIPGNSRTAYCRRPIGELR